MTVKDPLCLRKNTWWNMVLMLLVLSACQSSPYDQLKSEINKNLRTNNDINREEWNALVTLVLNHPTDFADWIDENGQIIEVQLIDEIYAISTARNWETPLIDCPSLEVVLPQAKIHVFIENSGSMNGYMKGKPEFESALIQLMVNLQGLYEKENISTYFINDTIYPIDYNEIEELPHILEPNSKQYQVGNPNASKLNEIIKLILGSVSQDNIAVLFSDCIYSIKDSENLQGALSQQKSFTQGVLYEILNTHQYDLSTIILKLNSSFDGKYYNKLNTGRRVTEERPYYVWLIGESGQMEKLQAQISLADLEGFQAKFWIKGATNSHVPFFTVLTETGLKGTFIPLDRDVKYSNGIKDITYDNGRFEFSMAVDLSQVTKDEAYLLDSRNYDFPVGFEILDIQPINQDNVEKRDWNRIKNTSVSHLFTIGTTSDHVLQNFQLKLMDKMPHWIYESTTLDDLLLEKRKDKTFGFNYLVEGVVEAYQQKYGKDTPLFELEVILKTP